MKNIITRSILVAFILIYNVKAESLLNYTFENQTNSWSLNPSSFWSISTNVVNTGLSSLKEEGTGQGWMRQTLIQTLNTTNISNLSFYVYTSTSSKTDVFLYFSDNTSQTKSFLNSGNSTWEYKDMTPYLAFNKVLIDINIVTYKPNNYSSTTYTTFYDTFNLQTIPEPSASTLIIYGLIALFLKNNLTKKKDVVG